MALDKSTRIIILLVIDTAFFLLELITGQMVHSLALIADSFHMLNDVISLCVGLWAVRVARAERTSEQLKVYTYGWQRAETLGALVNGVFLVALCVTIFIDAIQRFVEPQEVTQPVIILIVGCLGLASNLIGLLLFHDHSHGHGSGGHGHSHGHNHDISDLEEGHIHNHDHTHAATDTAPAAHGHGHAHEDQAGHGEGSEVTAVEENQSLLGKTHSAGQQNGQNRHSRTKSRAYSNIEDVYVNPARFRQSIIEAGSTPQYEDDEDEGQGPSSPYRDSPEGARKTLDGEDHDHPHDGQPLLSGQHQSRYGAIAKRRSVDHRAHKHNQSKESGHAGGHSHGDLNMRGIFLHVMGDALGNIGVIATALIIWRTNFSWRFYFDPAISLVITCIILASAIPLCKAASRILLQAVPAGISVDDIQDDIQDLAGVLSCHHLHVWQLSDTKLVASLHVQIAFELDAAGSARYMALAQEIRKCLHAYGIHSSTIQPEICLDPAHDHIGDASRAGSHSHEGGIYPSGPSGVASHTGSKAGSLRDPDACLLECGEECGGEGCCDPMMPKDPHQAHEHET